MLNFINKIHTYSPKIVWILLTIILIPTTIVVFQQKTIILEWNIIFILPTNIVFSIILDPIGIIFSCTVLIISANVLSFSSIYIINDQYIKRFTILVILFIISINLLIYIPHIIIILLGWDGLGLVSFLLVIYYQNRKSLAAGLITAIRNRIGDALLLIAIALTLDQGHWSIINILSTKSLIIQTLLIITAAMTKRAQIPFSRWLPAAIAAPTPVSALVHSSTLVTAGVFLLIRFYPFLHTLKIFNQIILTIAVCTILIAGLRATTECDIKKIIALSTLRQLGIIITRLGFNLPRLTFFHITTHALFKALLFIGAGSLINLHFHSQDLRWIGIVTNQIPITSSCITIANIALCGIPFIAGFYSKDIIVEIAIKSSFNILIIFIVIFRIILTSLYSIRFILSTISSPSQSLPWIYIYEYKQINNPIIILSLAAILSGSILMWINPVRNNISHLPIQIKSITILAISIGFLVSYFISSSKNIISSISNNINHYALCIIWFLVPLSTQFIIKYPINTAHQYLKIIDQGWLEIPQLIFNNLSIYNKQITIYYPKFTSNIIIITLLSLSIILISSI